MELKVSFNLPVSNFQIELNAKLLLCGSCFAENIGEKFLQNKFEALVNPLGISFNPLSLHKQLIRIAKNKLIDENELKEKDDVFYHWDFHSDFCMYDKTEMAKFINSKILEAHQFILNANVLIVSYGTSFYYELIESKLVVNNCHKFPGYLFQKKLGSIQDFTSSFNESYELLQAINPDLKIILTISPVKHYRDGIIENTHSKALLNCFVQEILSSNEDIKYFPSFEIMNEELRDYRFYKENFTHPTTQSIEYIWQRFLETYLSGESKNFITDFQKLKNNLSHKILFKGSNSHKFFMQKALNTLDSFKLKYLEKDFKQEEEYFKQNNLF